MTLSKNIFILWLQGWDNVSWLNKQVAESWQINNPDWKIHYICLNNLKEYIDDIDYIYDCNKTISPQAKSDIIRLSLLKKYGGIWADSTLLCMKPLDTWINEYISPIGFWMYHGHGAEMDKENGPASWFIVSEKDNYLITKWKEECDKYWLDEERKYADNYFWMDNLFKYLYNNNEIFKDLWDKVPYIYCELDGQSHTLAHHKMENNTLHIKKIFLNEPPFVLKLWNNWNYLFPNINTDKCIKSNAYFAIKMSKRIYKK